MKKIDLQDALQFRTNDDGNNALSLAVKENNIEMVKYFKEKWNATLEETIIPMRKLAGLMGHHLNNRAVCMLANERDVRKAIRIGQLAQMVDNATPWQFPCLAQALCVKWLLNRYRIPSVFYLGTMIVKQEAKPEMKAHAWVDVRQHTVVGAPQHKQYTPVASFVTPEPI